MTDYINIILKKISHSKINLKMIQKVTAPFVARCWNEMLNQTPYARDVINKIEKAPIYDQNNNSIGPEKSDHFAARAFIDSRTPINLIGLNPAAISFKDLSGRINATSTIMLQNMALQMLGAKLSDVLYEFPIFASRGSHLFFETGVVALDRTKFFISCMDIAKLEDQELANKIRENIRDIKLKITERDWELLQKLYKGEDLSTDEIEFLLEGLPAKIFSRSWEINEEFVGYLKTRAAQGNKPAQYAISAYLRGNDLNHATLRVPDIDKAYNILKQMRLNPVPIRGEATILQQTAAMAAEITYETSSGGKIKGPGAFLELACRPYMLINKISGRTIDPKGNQVDIDAGDVPFLLYEDEVELDESKWEPTKFFRDSQGNMVSLKQIEEGYYGPGSALLNKKNKAYCYEGFKELNAAGIFFAAGGSIKKRRKGD